MYQPRYQTLLEALAAHLDARPSRELYTFLDPRGREADRLDYAGLLRRATSVAELLEREGVQRGDRVLLVFPPDGLDFVAAFFGCLLAGAVAVPASSPDPRELERDLPVLRHICADCQARVALTHTLYRRSSQIFSARDAVRGLVRERRLRRPEWPELTWLHTNKLQPAGLEVARQQLDHALRDAGPETIAFLQYTSGSTSSPRGVTVRHRNLVHNLELIARNTRVDEDSVLVGWVPLYHDMGLTGGILNAAYHASRCVFFSPLTFLKNPGLWLEALGRYGGTHAAGPNFGYEYVLRAVTQASDYDLSRWRAALQGGEPMRATMIERVGQALAGSGFERAAFRNIYGMAETVLFVTGSAERGPTILQVDAAALEAQGRVELVVDDSRPSRALIGCGVPDAELDVEIRVVDPESGAGCAPGRVGELWLASPSNSSGYWGWGQAENDARFRVSISGDDGGRNYLRTGDLGFLHEGEVFICGRLTDLIIMAGRNVYPQDIEQSVEDAHPRIRRGNVACFGVERDGLERLVIVVEVKTSGSGSLDEVAGAVREVVAREHQLPCDEVVLIEPRTLPKTTSGKVQRARARERWRQSELRALYRVEDHTAEPTAMPTPPSAADTPGPVDGAGPESASSVSSLSTDELTHLPFVRAQLARLLKLTSAAEIAPERPLQELGLDSLMLMDLRDAIEARTGVALPHTLLFEHPTATSLASHLQGAEVTGHRSDAPTAGALTDATTLPLSSIQEAIWHDHQWLPGSHNSSHAFRIVGLTQTAPLTQACQRLIARHILLRASFVDDGDGPRMYIHERVDWSPSIEPEDLDEDQLFARMEQDIRAPFDAARAPLLRVRIFPQTSNDALVVQMTLHHLVYDGVAMGLLQGELMAELAGALRGAAPPADPPQIDYRVYLEHERRLLASAQADANWAYWRQRLAGSTLELPVGTRPAGSDPASYRQDTVAVVLDETCTAALAELGARHEATLFHVLLAAYLAALGHCLDTHDIALGTTASMRTRALAEVIGPIFNYVVIREQLGHDPPFATLLGRVRRTTVEALAHSLCPFKRLVDEIRGGADASARLGLNANFNLYNFDAMGRSSMASNMRTGRVELGAIAVESIPIARLPVIRPYDLQMGVVQASKTLNLGLRYNTLLLDGQRARGILCVFERTLRAALLDDTAPLSSLVIEAEGASTP